MQENDYLISIFKIIINKYSLKWFDLKYSWCKCIAKAKEWISNCNNNTTNNNIDNKKYFKTTAWKDIAYLAVLLPCK